MLIYLCLSSTICGIKDIDHLYWRCSLMKILFDSRTGNVKRFTEKLPFECEQITESSCVDEPYVLLTYTTGFGDLSPRTRQFLESNHRWLVAVAASGNRIWGDRFARSADLIATMYHVPILHKFELSGTATDVAHFIQEVHSIDNTNAKLSTKVGSA